jgi:hypothetical protein
MPVPVSVTLRETYWPGDKSRSFAALSPSHLLAVSIVKRPPSGIASRDLPQIGSLQSLICDDCESGSRGEFTAQRSQIMGGIRSESTVQQELGGDVGVTPPWRKDDRALG